MSDNDWELIRYPEGFDAPEQVTRLSDADLKQAGMAALQRNVWSPLAKATFAETWRRFSAITTLAEARRTHAPDSGLGAAFGLLGTTHPKGTQQ